MKKLIVTDTHLGMYSDSDVWLNVVLDFFKYITKYCIKNDIKEIYHLGDFFDNRKSLNTKTQHIAHRIAKILSMKKDLKIYIIVGNHDCYYKNQIHPNTLELFKQYNHIHIVDEPIVVDDILMVPWGVVPERTDAKYCFGHFSINGFHMNDSIKCKGGIDVAKFNDFKKVLSGHFHTPSSNHNITYVGSPYGQTFHDVNGIRGFHVFEDGRLTFEEYTDAPVFKKIYTTEDPLDPEEIKDNVVRIVFTKDFGTTKNQEIIDNVLECKPLLYSVNFANMESEDEEVIDESIEMDSKEKIVDQFIDSQTFANNINIITLKAMFKKLLKETGDTKTIKVAEGTRIECIEVGFQNFLSFGSRWQDVPLHNGVNFVVGLDKDKGKSNGAGKSSFLETIPFALFGKTARDITQNQIINWKNKKNCQVVFRFKINDDLYEINRQLKPNKLEIFKNGDLLDQEAHKKDYQSMFEEIFGMDVKMFMNLVHSNVNNSGSILSMKKAEKRSFLEKMFGLEIYSSMNKVANEKLKNLEQKKYKIQTTISSFDERIEHAEKLKLKFNSEIRSKKSGIEDVAELKEKLDKIVEDNPDINQQIEEVEKSIRMLKDEFNGITIEHEKLITSLETKLDGIEGQISIINAQAKQRENNEKYNDEIKKIVNKQGDFKTITKKIDELELELKKENKILDELNAKGLSKHKELATLQTNLKNVEKNLSLLSEGICPVCGQDVKDPQTHYKKEKDSLEKEIDIQEKEMDKLNKLSSDSQENGATLSNKIRIFNKLKDKLVELESKIVDVGTDADKVKLLEEKEEIRTSIVENKGIYEKNRKVYNDKIDVLNHKNADLTRIWSDLRNKKRNYEIALSKAEEIKNTIESLRNMLKEQNEYIVTYRSDKEHASIGIGKLNDVADYLNAIKFILKDENIKQFTIKQIMPFLNKQTNYYLSEVNYGFYVSIDKWLDVVIKGPGIRNATYESLSGGERRGIDIALQLSLLDISRTQAGIFPDILVFDELLDSSIDSRGIDSLMKIVKFKQNEFGGKFFIISHRDEIDSELIDHQYKVIKENGYSTVNI